MWELEAPLIQKNMGVLGSQWNGISYSCEI